VSLETGPSQPVLSDFLFCCRYDGSFSRQQSCLSVDHITSDGAGRCFDFKKLLIDNDCYVRRSWCAQRRAVRNINERLSAFLICCVIALLLVFHERAASFVVRIFGCHILFWLSGAAGEDKTPYKNNCGSHVGLKSANHAIAHGNGELNSPINREHSTPQAKLVSITRSNIVAL